MGKSLRSKHVQKMKTVKSKGVFGSAHDARAQRLAEKLQASAKEQIKDLQERLHETSTQMDLDKPEKKISTSGWSKKKKAKRVRKFR